MKYLFHCVEDNPFYETYACSLCLSRNISIKCTKEHDIYKCLTCDNQQSVPNHITVPFLK